MTEQKLKEHLAIQLEAIYHGRKTRPEPNLWDALAAEALEQIKQAGYVRLAEDQDIQLYPEIFASGLTLPSRAEMEMLSKFLSWLRKEANFRKVEL